MAYRRNLEGKDVIVAANFGPDNKCLQDSLFSGRTVLLSNAPVTLAENTLELVPAQVVVLA